MKKTERLKMARLDMFKKWDEWVDDICSDIECLTKNRDVYKQIVGIMCRNKIRKTNEFYEYITDTYGGFVLMSVRRQLDTRQDIISLRRLLDEIKCNIKVLSRNRFVKKMKYEEYCYDPCGNITENQQQVFEKNTERQANKIFDEYSGKGKEYIDQNFVKNDIERLTETGKILKEYATKHIAHSAKNKNDKKIKRPTNQDLDSCICVFQNLFNKYHILFRGEKHPFPGLRDDWKKIFNKAWLSEPDS